MKTEHSQALVDLMTDADHPHGDRDIYYVRRNADGTTWLL
jgi:hypothetical protein